MRLVCWNIGIKIDNSRKIAEFINSQQADIVALQEVVRHFEESVFDMYKSKKDIGEVIQKNLPYSFFGPLWAADAIRKSGKAIHRNFNGLVEQGNETISRYPIIEATNEFFHKHYSLGFNLETFFAEDHPRSVLITELDIDGKRIQILNLHGIYSKERKDSQRSLKQCKYVLKAAKRKDMPTIIVGDFNLLPDTESIHIINKGYRNLIEEYNIESTVPDFDHGTEHKKGRFVIDYIFVDDKIKVKDFKTIQTSISDHLPLILDFEIIS